MIGAATSPSAVADCISSAVPQQQSTPLEVSDRDSGDAISVSSVEMVPSTLKRPSQGEDSSRAEGPHRTDDAEVVPPPTFPVPRVQRTMYTESDNVPWLLAEWYTIRDFSQIRRVNRALRMCLRSHPAPDLPCVLCPEGHSYFALPEYEDLRVVCRGGISLAAVVVSVAVSLDSRD